jgi:hypothetical protein
VKKDIYSKTMELLIESKSKRLNTKKAISESKKPRRKSVLENKRLKEKAMLENRKYAPFKPFTDKEYKAFSNVKATEDFTPLIYDGDDERYERR